MITPSEEQVLKSFGQFIKEGRDARYLTQAEAASLVGITQTYLSCLEHGKRKVGLTLALNICLALRLDMGQWARNLSAKKVKVKRGRQHRSKILSRNPNGKHI